MPLITCNLHCQLACSVYFVISNHFTIFTLGGENRSMTLILSYQHLGIPIILLYLGNVYIVCTLLCVMARTEVTGQLLLIEMVDLEVCQADLQGSLH